MISAEIFRDKSGIVGFTVKNHGKSHVCAAVSMLVINTVNSIETFTDDKFTCDYNEEGGYLAFTLNQTASVGTAILLNAMVLGLTSTREQHPKQISIQEIRT